MKKYEDVIADDSRMQKAPERDRAHFLYALLFALSAAAALLQHGSPLFTVILLSAVIPCALFVYLPYALVNILSRQIVSCLIFCGAFVWGCLEVRKNVPYDLVLVESLAVASFTFLLGGRKKDYRYLLFICIFLLVYSALLPRQSLLLLIPAAFLVLLRILYVDRSSLLADGKAFPPKKERRFLRTWHLGFLQILIAVPVFLYVLSLIPLHDMGGEGFFEVSFMTERTSAMPKDLKKWFNQGKNMKDSPDGERRKKDAVPAETGSTGPKVRQPGTKEAQPGDGGGGSPGKDLLFTAELPVKLYHVGALYDVYDGKKWSSSPEMKKQSVRSPKENSDIVSYAVNGKYTMEKWGGKTLYSPYQLEEIMVNTDLSFEAGFDRNALMVRMDYTFYNCVMKNQEYPSLPFRYRITSRITIPSSQKSLPLPPENVQEESVEEGDPSSVLPAEENIDPAVLMKHARILSHEPALPVPAEVTGGEDFRRRAKVTGGSPLRRMRAKVFHTDPRLPERKRSAKKYVHDKAWMEQLPKKHYLQLPPDLSTRVTGLAGIITRGLEHPYAKAIALRDYLRTRYKYKLYASKVPPGRESVDYFLFTAKEGHCEYFAAALTVLARAAGLPARVVTGFSPGNFNAMTKQFEVYEYHAHAWSQIYIENLGWLTFDAVPPSSVISETTPAGIGLLRDPFGDEWRVTPPEITSSAMEYIRSAMLRDAKKSGSREKIEEAIARISEAEDEIRSNMEKVSAPSKNSRNKKASGLTVTGRLRLFFSRIFGDAGKMIGTAFSSERSRKIAGGTLLLAFIVFLLCSFATDDIRMICRRKRLNRFVREAERSSADSPAESVLALYRAVRLMLILAGMERKGNVELVAYARSLEMICRSRCPEKERIAAGFSEDVQYVFAAFYKVEYGSRIPSAEEVRAVRERVQTIHDVLRELYPDGFFFLEKRLFAPVFPERKR